MRPGGRQQGRGNGDTCMSISSPQQLGDNVIQGRTGNLVRSFLMLMLVLFLSPLTTSLCKSLGCLRGDSTSRLRPASRCMCEDGQASLASAYGYA